MINYLKGTIISKIEDSPQGCNLTIEVNGIGYYLLTNPRTLLNLPPEGETGIVYASLIHREDSMTLCGFSSKEDRDLFNLMLSVSGVGTKVAMFLSGELGAYGLVNAVLEGDVKALTKAKGVGPKLAQKIILELKDKMTGWRDKINIENVGQSDSDDFKVTQSYIEAETVLLSLGYTKKEAEFALKKATPNTKNKNDSEELLKLALQCLVAEGV